MPRPLLRAGLLELELIQSHMAQKPVLRGEVGCACVAREVSVERGDMGERGCAGFLHCAELSVRIIPRRDIAGTLVGTNESEAGNWQPLR